MTRHTHEDVARRGTRIVRVEDEASVAAAIEIAADAIRGGDLVGLPTETVYGLACALTDDAIEALLRAKGRPPQKGITLLVDSLADVERVAEVPDGARRLAQRFWPGPLTIVLPALADAGLPLLVTGPQFTVGVRLPDHAVPRALARELGPLPLTSANRSGEPDARDAGAVVDALGAAVRVVLDAGPTRGGVPSTVVALDESGVRVLRVGGIDAGEIDSALR